MLANLLPPTVSLLLITTALLSISTPASGQSIQGYVYWDQNGNGQLEENLYTHELENGVIDAQVEVRSCGLVADDDVADDAGAIATDKTSWPASYQGEREIEGHSAIYPQGGYYRFDNLASSSNGNCLLTDDELTLLQRNTPTAKGVGCYLSVIAPLDYEITSSFPVYDGNSANDDDGSTMVDPFHWIPHNDNQYGTSTTSTSTTESNNQVLINRGYRTRTFQCFGYNKGSWHVWSPSAGNSNEMQKMTLPNDVQYGYDVYLSESRNEYDRSLSIGPVGMVQGIWPLPLRVSSSLMLALKFGSSTTDGKYSDGGFDTSDPISSSNAVLLVDKTGNSQHRFQFETTHTSQALSLDDYLKSEAFENDTQQAYDDSNVEQTNNTFTNYQHTNTHGLLIDTFVLEDVLQTFLGEKVLKDGGGGGGGQEMKFINVVLGSQWSMVTVEDGAVGIDTTDGLNVKRTRKRVNGVHHVESHYEDVDDVGYARRLLRGGRSLASSSVLLENTLSSKKDNGSNINNHLQLRGSSITQRNLVSLPTPHLLFQLQIYGKYNEKKSDEVAAQRTTSNFGNHLSTTMNNYRDALIDRMRRRSGYEQECNPTSTLPSNLPTVGDSVPSGVEEYTEIEIGVVNRYDCDKLLPLYYFELDVLAVREMPSLIGSGGDSAGRGKEEQFHKALALLTEDDGIYGTPSVNAEESDNSNGDGNTDSSTPSWLLPVIIVVSALSIIGVAGGLYVRKEQKKLQLAREQKLLMKAERLKKKESRKISKKSKKQKRHVEVLDKSLEELVEELDGSLGDDELEDDNDVAIPLGGNRKKKKKKNRMRRKSSVDSDDSELDRLFASMNTAKKSKKDSEEAAAATERVEAYLVKKEAVRAIRRKKKTGASNSETDSNYTASNASGLNYIDHSSTSRDKSNASGLNCIDHSSTSRDNNPTLDTTTSGVTGKTKTLNSKGSIPSGDCDEEGEEGGNEGEGSKSDNGTETAQPPPRRIKVSKRDKMEKGISDLSCRLASSLRRSINHNALAEDTTEEGGGEQHDKDNKKKKVRKKRKKKKSSPESGEEEDAAPARSSAAPRRSRALDKVYSSFRGSFTGGLPFNDKDTGSGAGSDRNGKQKPKKKVRTKVPPPRKKRDLTNTMSSMRMSVRKLVIGELSSESSSSEDSDDRSSDSSSSSSDSSSGKPTKRQQQQRRSRLSADYKIKDVSKGEPHQHKGVRKQSDRHLGEDNPKIYESELTTTNDYLPHHSLDGPGPGHLTKGNSQRSMGSKSKSSRSGSDFNRSLGSDFNSRSKGSSHHGSSKALRRGSNMASNSESEGGSGATGHNHHGDRKKRTSRRHSPKKPSSSHHNHHNESKDRTRPRRLRPTLKDLKSSLTSSMTGMTKGKSLSEIAASALEEPSGAETKSEMRSKLGSQKGSNRGGASRGPKKSSHPHPSSDNGGEERRKKSSSSNNKTRSSHNMKHKHKSRSHNAAADADGATAAEKKSKRKSTHAAAH